MIILGIDPGTATTGYGVIENNQGNLKAIKYGCILTDKKLKMPERLDFLGEELKKIIKKYQPQAMAIEELFFFKNAKTIITVGQARGVILFIGTNAGKNISKKTGLDIYEYTPLQVKQAVVGYGRADKKQVQNMVKAILDLDEIPKPDDAADALAVAICCDSSIKFERKVNGNRQ